MRRGTSFSGGRHHAHTHHGVASPGTTSVWVGAAPTKLDPMMKFPQNNGDVSGAFHGRLGKAETERKNGHTYVIVSVRDSASEYKAGRKRVDAGVHNGVANSMKSVSGDKIKLQPNEAANRKTDLFANVASNSSSNSSRNVTVSKTASLQNPTTVVVTSPSHASQNGDRDVNLRRSSSSAASFKSSSTSEPLLKPSAVAAAARFVEHNGNAKVVRKHSTDAASNNSYSNLRRSSSVKTRSEVPQKGILSRSGSTDSYRRISATYSPTAENGHDPQLQHSHAHVADLANPLGGSINAGGLSNSYLVGGNAATNLNLSLLAGTNVSSFPGNINNLGLLTGTNVSGNFSNLGLLGGATSGNLNSLGLLSTGSTSTTNLLGSMNNSTGNLLASGSALGLGQLNPTLAYGVLASPYNGVSFFPAVSSVPTMMTLPVSSGMATTASVGYDSSKFLKQQLTDPEYLAKSLQETLRLTSGGGVATPLSTAASLQTELGTSLVVSSSLPYQPFPHAAQPLYVGQSLGALPPYQGLSLADQQQRALNAALAASQISAHYAAENAAWSPTTTGSRWRSSSSSTASLSSPPTFSLSADQNANPFTLTRYSSFTEARLQDDLSPPLSSPRTNAVYAAGPLGQQGQILNGHRAAVSTESAPGPRSYSAATLYSSDPRAAYDRSFSGDHRGDEFTREIESSFLPSSPSDWHSTSPSNGGDFRQEQGESPQVVWVEPVYERPRDRESCMKCGKKVYAMEKMGPVKDVVYHKACFVCRVCHATLGLKNFHHNEEDLADLAIYCASHKPSARSGHLESQVLGVTKWSVVQFDIE